LLGSVAGLAISAGSSVGFAQSATPAAPAGDAGPMQLPTISVRAPARHPIQPSQPSLPKLTEPLLDTPHRSSRGVASGDG
jgi:outer membrane receptor for monomeric catechols